MENQDHSGRSDDRKGNSLSLDELFDALASLDAPRLNAVATFVASLQDSRPGPSRPAASAATRPEPPLPNLSSSGRSGEGKDGPRQVSRFNPRKASRKELSKASFEDQKRASLVKNRNLDGVLCPDQRQRWKWNVRNDGYSLSLVAGSRPEPQNRSAAPSSDARSLGFGKPATIKRRMQKLRKQLSSPELPSGAREELEAALKKAEARLQVAVGGLLRGDADGAEDLDAKE